MPREDDIFKTCAFRKTCPFKDTDHEPFVQYGTRHHAHARCLLREKGETAFDLLSLNALENFPALAAHSAGLLQVLERKLNERRGARGAQKPLATDQERVKMALRLALSFGGIGGEHHKTWVIDQMVRALTGSTFSCGADERDASGSSPVCVAPSKEYEAWVAEAKAGTEGPNSYDWEEGIAP